MHSHHRTRLLRASLLASFLLLLPTGFAQARSADQSTGPGQLALTFTNVKVSHDQFLAHSEPAIAENPSNPKNLVASSKLFSDPAHYQFKIGTFYSMDGGRTWQDSGLLPGFENQSIVSDVSLAFSPNGSIVYAAVLACGPDRCSQGLSSSGIYVSWSKDGGKTWSMPIAAFLDTTGATFSDKPWIAVDQTHGPSRGTVYVAWNLDGNTAAGHGDPGKYLVPQQALDLPPPGVVLVHSTDYGRTFSAPVVIMPFDAHNSAIGATPSVGPDGHVQVLFLTFRDTPSTTISNIEIATSTDQGQTFSPLRIVAASVAGLPNHLPNSNFRNLSLPAFTVSPSDGSMVVTWADERNGDADILAERSTDGGHTWSKPVRVNNDPRHNGKDQFQPAIAVAPNGTYTCSWFDRRRDPKNRLIDVYVAQSSNGGLSFGRNVRVTQKAWNPAIDAPLPEGNPNNTFIGDYQALAVDDRTVHPLWNDTQNGTSQEIRTAIVSVQVFVRKK